MNPRPVTVGQDAAWCVVLKKVYKKNFIWGQNAAGRCVSVSEVRGDAARCGGTRPRSVFRSVDCQ